MVQITNVTQNIWIYLLDANQFFEKSIYSLKTVYISYDTLTVCAKKIRKSMRNIHIHYTYMYTCVNVHSLQRTNRTQ